MRKTGCRHLPIGLQAKRLSGVQRKKLVRERKME
jgi:hypothetical protein